MTSSDYLNILKNVKATECVTKFNGVKRNSGTELFVFIHDTNGYKLKLKQDDESKQILTNTLKIYIKISVNPKTKVVISYVSFHDADPSVNENPLTPLYYDVSDDMYEFAESIITDVNDKFVKLSEPGKIVNQFKYDSVHTNDNELVIIFVDSYDEDFEISVGIDRPFNSTNAEYYKRQFVEKLIDEWNDRDKYYRDNFWQNE
jgi:hypothetical protein